MADSVIVHAGSSALEEEKDGAVSEGDNHEPPERRDGLYREVIALREDLRNHIAEEMPVIRKMMQELGSTDQVRERRIFIEILILREAARAKLRTALIEKGLLLALLAFITFVAVAIWHELGAAIKLMLGKQ